MKLVPCRSQQSLGPVKMLSAEVLHETWPFGHLSSYPTSQLIIAVILKLRD